MESKLGAAASKRFSIVHQPQDLQAGFLHLPRKKPKRLPQPDELASKDRDKVSYYAAKDLRIKRVFSPNLVNLSSAPAGKQFSDKEGPITANRSCPNKDSGVGKISETTEEVRSENFRNSNGYVKCDEKCEELVLSTPPDAEILAGGVVAPSSNEYPRSSDGGVLGDICAKGDCRIDSATRTGSVLKPCSKRKLFKAPGSIAYKRLLPFLLDTDNYTIQGDLCPKRENNLEKKANIETNMCNRAKESSFVDSDACIKNAVFASGMSCKTIQRNLPPPDNGVTRNFRNSSDSNNELTLVKEDSGLKKDNVVCSFSLEERLTENEGPTKHPIEYRSSKDGLDGGSSFISSNISSEVDNCKLHVSEKLCNNVSEDTKKENHLNEELKMSSLDSNLACKPVKEERRDEKVECARGTDQNLGGSTVGENHCNIAFDSDKKIGSYVRNKVIRNPLVQLKSKYSQVSVSYRRMLPFLEDLFKNNSENCTSGNIDQPGSEKELPTTNSQPPSSNSHNYQDKSEGLVSGNRPCDGNSDTSSMSVFDAMNETVSETEKVLMPARVNDKLPSPPELHMHSEQETLDKYKLKIDTQLPGATLLNEQGVSSLYPAAGNEPLIGERSRMISERSSITSEGCTSLTDNVSDGAKVSERHRSEPNSACVLPESQINVRKGILKRNPRGCRGICNCLNCSSFRLHAERAFEFSRNQLQDAEEVASDLMKELSFLRGVLAKYSDGAKGDAGYHSNQVKEACRKASEAELVAKDRLIQMNYELDIHSRIACSQQPNVRFSSEVEKIESEDGK